MDISKSSEYRIKEVMSSPSNWDLTTAVMSNIKNPVFIKELLETPEQMDLRPELLIAAGLITRAEFDFIRQQQEESEYGTKLFEETIELTWVEEEEVNGRLSFVPTSLPTCLTVVWDGNVYENMQGEGEGSSRSYTSEDGHGIIFTVGVEAGAAVYPASDGDDGQHTIAVYDCSQN